MAAKQISIQEQKKTLDAMKKFKKADGTYDFYKIAQDLGIHKVTAHRRVAFLEKNNSAAIRRFDIPSLPHKSRQIDELIQDRLVESERVIAADEARELIDIKVNIDGPYGLLIFGDPHIDDPGCAFHLLKAHIEKGEMRIMTNPSDLLSGHGGVYYCDAGSYDISSTKIRQLIQEGQTDAAYLQRNVPADVLSYIQQHNLFGRNTLDLTEP